VIKRWMGLVLAVVACSSVATRTEGQDVLLTVDVVGGNGTVSPGTGLYTLGTTNTLTATPDEHCAFLGWGGNTNGCTINGNQVDVPIDGARSITAEFTGGPWAYEVVGYMSGTNVATDYWTGEPYTNTASSLGRPTRDGAWGDITMFSSPYQDSELVSIGSGGYLAVRFDHPVSNDVLNPFGADLIIFGNSFFWDSSYPDGEVAALDNDPGTILVSQNGTNWHEITAITADGAYPSQGYRDTSSAYGSDGTTPSDFLMPVDTNLAWVGSDYPTMLAGYNGAGGGAPVDISATGLDWIQYVMVTQALGQGWSTEIDGFSDVAAVAAFTLTVNTEGRGHVNLSNGTHQHGTNITLVATPGTYFYFAEWTGATQGDTATHTMGLCMDRHRSITAVFDPDMATNETPVHWLVENGLTNATYPTFDAAALADIDHDGFCAWEEFLSGTDADNIDSFFHITDMGRVGDSNYVTWLGGTNGSDIPFQVEHTSSLTNGWMVLDGNVRRSPTGTNTFWYGNSNDDRFVQIRVVL